MNKEFNYENPHETCIDIDFRFYENIDLGVDQVLLKQLMFKKLRTISRGRTLLLIEICMRQDLVLLFWLDHKD